MTETEKSLAEMSVSILSLADAIKTGQQREIDALLKLTESMAQMNEGLSDLLRTIK